MIVVCMVLHLICFYYVMRYNLHMFQLNGYKNDEQMVWLRKNGRKQLPLLLLSVSVVCLLCFRGFVPLILDLLLSLLVIQYFVFMKKIHTKKKLVFTMRVKRLVFTDFLLGILSAFLFSYFLSWREQLAFFAIYVLLQPLVILLVNTINAPMEKSVKQYYINDAKKILKKNPNLVVIGVTGSFGKTSVKFYLETLLKEKFNVLVTPESYNTPMGVVKTIRESLKSTHEIFICEMGARAVGEIKEICDIVNPTHGVITAVGPQHLETFLSIDNILNTKFELADALPKKGMLFLNGDNDLIRQKAGDYEEVSSYSMNHQEGYYASNVELSQSGTRFTVTTPQGEACAFQTRVVGEHNVLNILAAISVAHRMGVPLTDLRIPVRRIQAIPHRMQLIEKGNLTIIDDAFNSNPTGSRVAVETLKMFDGLRILITPGMVELGEMEEELNYKFGTYAAECCDYIYLVGKKRTEPIRNGILAKGFATERCIVCDHFQDAMDQATTLSTEKHKYILLENDLPDNY